MLLSCPSLRLFFCPWRHGTHRSRESQPRLSSRRQLCCAQVGPFASFKCTPGNLNWTVACISCMWMEVKGMFWKPLSFCSIAGVALWKRRKPKAGKTSEQEPELGTGRKRPHSEQDLLETIKRQRPRAPSETESASEEEGIQFFLIRHL